MTLRCCLHGACAHKVPSRRVRGERQRVPVQPLHGRRVRRRPVRIQRVMVTARLRLFCVIAGVSSTEAAWNGPVVPVPAHTWRGAHTGTHPCVHAALRLPRQALRRPQATGHPLAPPHHSGNHAPRARAHAHANTRRQRRACVCCCWVSAGIEPGLAQGRTTGIHASRATTPCAKGRTPTGPVRPCCISRRQCSSVFGAPLSGCTTRTPDGRARRHTRTFRLRTYGAPRCCRVAVPTDLSACTMFARA